MRLGVPARHIQADFADERLGHADIDAVDPGQVDAADAVEFTPQVKLWRMAPRFPTSLAPRAPRLLRGCLGGLRVWGPVGHLVGDARRVPAR